MSFLGIIKTLLSPSATIAKGFDLVDKMVIDQDQANDLKAKMYMMELQTSTIPIVDAIHKLGRQGLALLQIVFYLYALHKNWPITPELVAGVSGATGIYTIAKGRGK